jgi:transposase
MVAAAADTPLAFSLSPGQAGDAPEGRKLLRIWDENEESHSEGSCFMVMDRAYEGDETRELVESLGHVPVVPPKSNRLEPWEYDHELYKRRNEIERLFRLLKGFRRLATRYDKLDVMFLAFLTVTFIWQLVK